MRKFLARIGAVQHQAAFVIGLLVALIGLVGGGSFMVQRVHAADCDSNAIIYCGASSASSFISKVKANDDGHGHHDLQAIYGHSFYGGQNLPSSLYDDFASHAFLATAYKDGTIKYGNWTVMTGAKSIGRLASYQGSGYSSYTVNGVTYYGNTNAKAFASDSIPVLVMFDAQGNVRFAVLTSCGNPIFGTPVPSGASCTMLNKTAISGQANTYSFTSSAHTTGNGIIKKYVYDFGDGSPTVTTTSGSTKVTHTYTRAGTFTAKVQVYASWPGTSDIPLTIVSDCTKQVTVSPPPAVPFYQCVQLAGAAIDQQKMSFRFVATAQYGNGATFTSADFNFGDGNSQNGVQPNGSTVTVTHTYAQPGTYNIGAILHFMANGQAVTAPTCTAVVSPTLPPTPTCKPGVPVGSPECAPPCTEGSSTPPGSPECTPPQTSLPNTGTGNTIAIVSAVAIIGFMVYRHVLYRRHRNAFLSAEYGTSPLPLGDPLNDQAPLAETPLQPKQQRKSFRRRRPF